MLTLRVLIVWVYILLNDDAFTSIYYGVTKLFWISRRFHFDSLGAARYTGRSQSHEFMHCMVQTPGELK